MITIKSENFRETIGKLYDTLVGEKDLARGIYLRVDDPVSMRLSKLSDRVVIDFTENKPKLKVNIWPVAIEFTEISKITIFTDKAIIALDGFPDVEIVEEKRRHDVR